MGKTYVPKSPKAPPPPYQPDPQERFAAALERIASTMEMEQHEKRKLERRMFVLLEKMTAKAGLS